MTNSSLLTHVLACTVSAAACGVLNMMPITRSHIRRNLLIVGAALLALSAACGNNVALAGAAAAPLACAVAGLSMRALRGLVGLKAVIHPDSAAVWGPAYAEGVQVAAANLDMEKARAAVCAHWAKREKEGNEAAKKLKDKDWSAAMVVEQCAHEFRLSCEERSKEQPQA